MNLDILFEESRESFGRVQGIQTFDKNRGKNKTFSLKKAGNPDVLFEERRESRHSNIREQGIQNLFEENRKSRYFNYRVKEI